MAGIRLHNLVITNRSVWFVHFGGAYCNLAQLDSKSTMLGVAVAVEQYVAELQQKGGEIFTTQHHFAR